MKLTERLPDDEMGKAPVEMKFENGSTWQEMRNYWFFLIAKSLVQQGWDKDFQGTKRPFVWVRGMTAGAQRYATLWSGDIHCSYDEMKNQIRGMQLSGLSGFPFWGHDAGGFNPDNSKELPDNNMYRQWSMAFGSFSPFWKPHGPGNSRWPLDRSIEAQEDSKKKFIRLRYELIPYIYTYAHKASETGLPIARAMIIDNQNDSIAWKSDLQYMWGDEFLVAPNCSDGEPIKVWLPKGEWFNYWDDRLFQGDQILQYQSSTGYLPLYVKGGSIVPMANYALSTSFFHDDSLNIHVYPGRDGRFELYEDDGESESYRIKNESRITVFNFKQAVYTLEINPAKGNYRNGPVKRFYRIEFHNVIRPFSVSVNGVTYKLQKKLLTGPGVYWDEARKVLTVQTTKLNLTSKISIKRIAK